MDKDSSYSEETDFLLSSVREMRHALYELDHSPLAGYNLIKCPETIDGIYMMFYEMLSEYLRTIANEINTLSRWTDEIGAWEIALKTKSEYEKFFLHHIAIDSLTIAATNLPYALKQRFAFCISHTTHQANRFLKPGWSELELPPDEKIGVNTLDKICGNWKQWPKLKLAVSKVNSEKFIQSTRDFRSHFNHRIPLKFGYGHTNMVRRKPINEAGKIGANYGFGGQEPLQLYTTMQSLKLQVLACLEALECYVSLLLEQKEQIHSA